MPPAGSRRADSVSKSPFRHAGRLQKGSEDKQRTPVGVQRYGRACVAQEVKIIEDRLLCYKVRNIFLL